MSRPEIDLGTRRSRDGLRDGRKASLPALVAAAKASIADPSPVERAILARLDEALARTEEGRLRVAMLGQFKRGKSTLLNALLGVPLLPTWITPVTAIPTYVNAARSPLLRIEFEGLRKPLELRDASEFSSVLARYVAESENAGNREQVRSVKIALNSATFSDRVVFVDTPGVGSTFLHNSRTAEAVLGDCDVGIFVLSPDPPSGAFDRCAGKRARASGLEGDGLSRRLPVAAAFLPAVFGRRLRLRTGRAAFPHPVLHGRVSLALACGDFSHTMLILYAVQALTPRYGQGAGAIAIELYALHNVLYAVGSYPVGALADRYGKRPFLLAAYSLAAAMNLILIVAAPSTVTLVVVFVLAGAAYALQQSLERAIAADLTPVEVRSTGFGVLAAASGVGDLVSSAIVGTLWTAVSPQVGFAYALVMSVVGAIVTRTALRAVGRP